MEFVVRNEADGGHRDLKNAQAELLIASSPKVDCDPIGFVQDSRHLADCRVRKWRGGRTLPTKRSCLSQSCAAVKERECRLPD